MGTNKYTEIGKRLKLIRGRASQRAFAKQIGVSFGAYRNYEAGKRVPPDGVLQNIIYNHGSITTDWILTGVMDLEAARKGIERRAAIRGFNPEDLERNKQILERIYTKGDETTITTVERILSALDPKKDVN